MQLTADWGLGGNHPFSAPVFRGPAQNIPIRLLKVKSLTEGIETQRAGSPNHTSCPVECKNTQQVEPRPNSRKCRSFLANLLRSVRDPCLIATKVPGYKPTEVPHKPQPGAFFLPVQVRSLPGCSGWTTEQGQPLFLWSSPDASEGEAGLLMPIIRNLTTP